MDDAWLANAHSVSQSLALSSRVLSSLCRKYERLATPLEETAMAKKLTKEQLDEARARIDDMDDDDKNELRALLKVETDDDVVSTIKALVERVNKLEGKKTDKNNDKKKGGLIEWLNGLA